MYEIWVRCGQYCESFEDDRMQDKADDPATAILISQSLRDSDHETWIVTKTV